MAVTKSKQIVAELLVVTERLTNETLVPMVPLINERMSVLVTQR